MKKFDNIVIIDICIGVFLYLFYSPINFPSGIVFFHMIPKKKKQIKTMNARLGVFCMHFPAPLVFLYNVYFYPNGQPFSIPAICFLVMTSYRALIYPLFRNKYASRIPIKTVILYNLVSFNLGLCASILLTFERQQNTLVKDSIIAAIFGILGLFTIIHDWIICRLRNEKGYSIDHLNVLLWKKFTCPHYLLQFLQWCTWSFYIAGTGDSLSFILPIAYLTISRADIVHGFMCQSIPGYAYAGRKPCLPFVSHSKFFLDWIMRY